MTDEVLLGQIVSRVNSFASERGYKFSRAKDRILKELVRMHQLSGDYYCPCQPESTAATVCVCDEVRLGSYVDLMGKCHCNLFTTGE
ncbi:MAG: hypothetical protein M1358_08380 [Chloroflexi bacterium]|nr:hypothetical protein [Chloroflexota bacterium]